MTSQSAAAAPPPCPITGEPAARLIQEIPRSLLIQLWRHAGGVELGHLLRGRGELGSRGPRISEQPAIGADVAVEGRI